MQTGYLAIIMSFVMPLFMDDKTKRQIARFVENMLETKTACRTDQLVKSPDLNPTLEERRYKAKAH